jgi:hypothetical protein
LKNAADARYVSTGHLVFMRLGQLFAVRFDAARLEVEGEPVPVLKDVAQTLTAANENSGTGQFAIASGGALAWIQSPVATVCDSRIVTVDQTGRVSPVGPPPRKYGAGLRVSPDGRQLAVTIRSLTEVGLWLYDLDRVGRLKPLRRTGEAYWPLWSRDGRSVMFQGLTEGRFSLESWSADESAPPVVRITPDWSPSSWTGDGLLVAAGPTDLVVGSFDKGHDAFRRVSQSGEIAAWPEISPDGRWLAYGSKASGRFEIYVQPYPGQAGGVPVSVEGGESPVWHPDGRELFYVSPPDPAGERRMMVVGFEPGARPRIGTPRALFHFAQHDFAFTGCPVRGYDLAPDGKRFYVFQRAAAPAAPVVTHIEIVLNWLTDLQVTLPGARGN